MVQRYNETTYKRYAEKVGGGSRGRQGRICLPLSPKWGSLGYIYIIYRLHEKKADFTQSRNINEGKSYQLFREDNAQTQPNQNSTSFLRLRIQVSKVN